MTLRHPVWYARCIHRYIHMYVYTLFVCIHTDVCTYTHKKAKRETKQKQRHLPKTHGHQRHTCWRIGLRCTTYTHLSCRSFSAKEPLFIGLFCGKWPVNIRKASHVSTPPSTMCYIHTHLSCRSFSAKEPLFIGLFCGKWPVKIRHPMSLRHPLRCATYTHTSVAGHFPQKSHYL